MVARCPPPASSTSVTLTSPMDLPEPSSTVPRTPPRYDWLDAAPANNKAQRIVFAVIYVTPCRTGFRPVLMCSTPFNPVNPADRPRGLSPPPPQARTPHPRLPPPPPRAPIRQAQSHPGGDARQRRQRDVRPHAGAEPQNRAQHHGVHQICQPRG